MASLPIRSGLSSSQSPYSGSESIINNEMVQVSITSPFKINFKGEEFPEEYTLNDLLQDGFRSEEVKKGVLEKRAEKWIKAMVGDIKGRQIQVSSECAMPNPLPNFQPFKGNYVIKPDVTVMECNLSILTFEVVSGNNYQKTVTKSIENCVEMLRIWRTCNPSVDVCTCFVFPDSQHKSCVMKVSVKFEEYIFRYSLEYVLQKDVRQEIKEQINKWEFKITHNDNGSFFVRLNQQECDTVEPGAIQVRSRSSLILRNQSNTTYWKYNKYRSVLYERIAVRGIVERQYSGRNYLQFSLLPFAEERRGRLEFHKFDAIQDPLTRDEAKSCLIRLLDGLRRALEELHSEDIAHLDVRLPNVCFKDQTVILIDLDMCGDAYRICSICSFHHHTSDMYHTRHHLTNRQVDWRSVGMMICYILDEKLKPENYHEMLSENLVQSEIRNEPFVKHLLEEGEWDGKLYLKFEQANVDRNQRIPR